ncbi:unnamed protein product [Victoria cruziana]
MAVVILARSLSGLRSVRPSIPRARNSPISNSFLIRLVCCLVHPTLLVSATSGSAYCVSVGSAQTCRASYSTQSLTSTEPVVSVDWLHDNLRDPYLKVLDASWYMPDEKRNPLQEYQMAHIPGALFFDVDGISDRNSSVRLL